MGPMKKDVQPIGFNVPPPSAPYDDAGQTNPPQQQQTNVQYPPQQQQHVIQQTISTPIVGPNPAPMICPFCRQQIVSRTYYDTTLKTHIIAMVLCFGCCFCSWLPYVMDSCKTASHHCPNCGALIGVYNGGCC